MTIEELRSTMLHPSHHGFGFAVAYRDLRPAAVSVAEKVVVARASHLGLTSAQLLVWTDSKYGRWFSDHLGMGRGAACIREYLTPEIIEELTSEATDDLIEGLESLLS